MSFRYGILITKAVYCTYCFELFFHNFCFKLRTSWNMHVTSYLKTTERHLKERVAFLTFTFKVLSSCSDGSKTQHENYFQSVTPHFCHPCILQMHHCSAYRCRKEYPLSVWLFIQIVLRTAWTVTCSSSDKLIVCSLCVFTLLLFGGGAHTSVVYWEEPEWGHAVISVWSAQSSLLRLTLHYVQPWGWSRK